MTDPQINRSVEQRLETAFAVYRTPAEHWTGPLSVGIDLGTSTCAIAVVDAQGVPVWMDSRGTAAIRDGVVFDYWGARDATASLKEDAEAALGVAFTRAATAFPPGVDESDSRACGFVLESAGFDDILLLDEVSAANLTLGIDNGVVVDVGGGSTGVGVFRDGRLVALDDRPGGGHHLDLILAGSLGIPLEQAELLKRTHADDYLGILRPGLERVAESIRALSLGAEKLDVHLAGGALMIDGADRVIAAYLGRPVRSYPHALYITPLGIARHAS
ncbi:ethanolamine utilization protein EutJ [Cryobacterium frigoriphilum]|uniref:Ethanolamine utilization protein EutJ n=2 Tax=Cryobacterium frigoriphilum TaxID=1259150 RepID=A0A4R8ZZV4_9MICO|nr:ethanolamine utilization protein EutJ [Cryobacterium frigoriphilum]